MKKYLYLIILIMAVAVPAMLSAQNRPASAKQNKDNPKIQATHQGIKQNKLVKTTDPEDEYAKIAAERYSNKSKQEPKKEPKKNVDVGVVDEADDVRRTVPAPEPFYLIKDDEAAQSKKQEPVEIPNKLKERPGTPEEGYYDNYSDLATPPYAYTQSDDPGTESEDDILMAGDSAMVHTLKMDVSEMEPVEIMLTNPDAGQFFVFPTPSYAIPTSHFGPRRRRFHYGLDLGLHTGEPIYAAFDGVVRFSKYNSSYGNLIVIRHDNGLETYYAHLSKRHVSPGARVKAGEEIGLCGNTGRSRGSHLHFEIRYNGNALNPENVVSCETRTLLAPTLTLTRDSFRKVAKSGYSNTSASRARTSNYSSDGKYYKVRTGDTLSRIAKRNGTTVSKLCKLNGLRETSVIRPGQKLRIR